MMHNTAPVLCRQLRIKSIRAARVLRNEVLENADIIAAAWAS
jgi:hypothetical protein